jgi:hypothetical protein
VDAGAGIVDKGLIQASEVMGSSRVTYLDLYEFFLHTTGNREHTNVRESGHLTFFDTECGMFLYRPPLPNEDYSCTPRNTKTFASTGGDGCHFGFLLTDGEWTGQSPVVMTYPPPARANNVVVGEDLREFLCLGINIGYFCLEQLALRPERLLGEYPDPGEFAPWVEERERELLSALAERFCLAPWAQPAQRLQELQERYLPLVSGGAWGDEAL